MKVFTENERGKAIKNIFNERTLEYVESRTVSAPYPYPYGFVTETLSGDGDCLDCFVLTNKPLKTGDAVDVEPIALMEMKEDGEIDHKIIARLIDDVIIAVVSHTRQMWNTLYPSFIQIAEKLEELRFDSYNLPMTDKTTISTYDNSAEQLAAYFAGIGSRLDIIKEALEAAGKPKNARVIEVGCGDGRDAEDIVPLVKWYEGFDPSVELIRLAHQRKIRASFVQADALSYNYPSELDVIFGFASYLHVNRDDFAKACRKAATSLRRGGILAITLKERDGYEEELVKDEFGERWFYYYDEDSVKDILGEEFEITKIDHKTLNRKTAKWLVILARKI